MAIVSKRVAAPTHPFSRLLLDFWQARSGGGTLLDKREVCCRELAALMPFLYLFEPTDTALSDWRCRLIGSAMAERYGFKGQLGRTLAEIDGPEVAAFRADRYREVITSGEPAIARGRLMNIGRDFYEVEVIHIPVAAGDGCRCVLGGMFFFE